MTDEPACPNCGHDLFVEQRCHDEHRCHGCETTFGGDCRCPTCGERFATEMGRRVHESHAHVAQQEVSAGD